MLCYFEHELYIDVHEDKFKKALSRFRLASHSLEIETGRYINSNRMERKCKYCSMIIVESEFHFLCICPLYRDLNIKFLRRLTQFQPFRNYCLLNMLEL